MRQVKFPTTKEVHNLVLAIKLLEKARQIENEAGKRVKAAKEIIRAELIRTRDLDIEMLPEHEMVIVTIGNEYGVKVDRRATERINVKGLRVQLPDIAERFTTRIVGSYFDPLILSKSSFKPNSTLLPA